MALWKRGKRYWTDFTVNGTRYRLPLDTQDQREAKRLEKEKIADAQVGKLAPSSINFARLGFTEAAGRHLEERRHGLARYSVRTEQERSRCPKSYFGTMPLNRITADHLREYIVWRKSQKPQRGDAPEISNRTVNMEMAFIRRLLKRAKRLHIVADDLKALPERRDIGRALTLEEKLRLIQSAKGKAEWDIARLALMLALNTTMRGCELRGLRWRDVNLIDRTLTIRHSKTEAGERVITLNADALGAILELRDRAKGFFGDSLSPDWYVFPGGEGQGPKVGANKATVKPDPAKPMTSWRSAWRSIRAAAAKGDPEKGIPAMPGLASLRFHDLRHHAITELAESAASYVYDGDGQRVKKTVGSTVTLFWRDLGGNALTETDGAGSLLRDYLYFAGNRMAVIYSSTPKFYFGDQVGSSRVVTFSNGQICYDADFYPFGGERTPYVNSCAQNYKFAGMERDPESGNDHTMFRQYASNYGRWLSPDPLAGDVSNPQSLNRYAYVLNNPTNLIDKLGLCAPGVICVTSWAWAPNGAWGGSGDRAGDPVLVDRPGSLPHDTGSTNAKDPLSPKDQARYYDLRGKAIADIMDPECLVFLCSHGIDPTMLQLTIAFQQAFNGSKSTITKADAQVGMPGPGDTVSQGFRQPGVHAVASLNGTDVYFRSGGFWFLSNGNIQESTIEHEALHNYLKIGDTELQQQLGVPVSSDTTDINQALKDHKCTK